ncbi:T9SS type A sorting domain-containing protein [Flavobacteriaceae bacterium SZ-1-7]|uniref:T9SS type A sorting domain-containing protein n=1 Tax=Tamlana sedimenti TaxID=3134126 RepID=UPI003124825B
MKKYLLFMLIPLLSFGQSLIGSGIDGKTIGDNFGTSMSLSSDGKIIAIGDHFNSVNNESNPGHVSIFEYKLNEWKQIGATIDGEDLKDRSGFSVSLSSDGSIVAIGAVFNDGNGTSSGHVRVFENVSGNWIQIGNDINGAAEGDLFGHKVSLSSDGSIVAIGALHNDGNGMSSGHVRVFKNISEVWTQIGNDIVGEATGDRFGNSLCLSSDGNILAIGGVFNDGNGDDSGHVRVFENVSGNWIQIGNDIDGEAEGDWFGASLCLSSNGNIVVVGAPQNDENGDDSGHVRVFENVSGNWIQIGDNVNGKVSGNRFGEHLSLSADGFTFAVGVPFNDENGENTGHVRIFNNISGSWVELDNNIYGHQINEMAGLNISLSADGFTLAVAGQFNDGYGNITGNVVIYDLFAVLSIESFNKNHFKLYPIPINDVLNIHLNSGYELKQVNIYNIQSQYLYSVKTLKINVKDLASGIYFIEIETNKGKSTKKIVVE